MSLPPAESLARRLGWLGPTALLALAPKCVLCLATYAGVGVALGVGGPELCGGSAGAPGSWATSLAWFGGLVGLGMGGLVARGRRRRSLPARTSAFGRASGNRVPGPARRAPHTFTAKRLA